jgi:uncharacterized delta-60 repeat protein
MNRSFSISRKTSTRRRPALHPRTEPLEGRKLLSAGDLDLSFGNGGYVLTSPRPDPKNGQETGPDEAMAVQVQSDGSMFVGGYSLHDFSIVKLSPNGAKDTSFGTGGGVLTDFFGDVDTASDMAIQPDGRVVVVGTVNVRVTTKGTTSVTPDFGLVRYLPNGALDSSFGPSRNGKVNTNLSTYEAGGRQDRATSVALQADGKIVVGGLLIRGPASSNSNYDAVLVRYDTAGNLDPTFGQGGKVATSLSPGYDAITDIEILPDGKILVAGGIDDANGQRRVFAARYDASGNLDPTFGSAGVAIAPVGSVFAGNASLALQSDGGIVVVYASYNGSNQDIGLGRFTVSGQWDTTFGIAGVATRDLGGDEISIWGVVQADDKILVAGQTAVVAGQTASDSLIARFNRDGSLDDGSTGDSTPGDSFGSGGVTIHSFSTGREDHFAGLTLQPDGKIVAVGTATSIWSRYSELDFLVARFQGDSASSIASASLSAQGASRATASREASLLTPLDSVNDLDLTQVATEWLRSTPKRSRPTSRSSYRPMIP